MHVVGTQWNCRYLDTVVPREGERGEMVREGDVVKGMESMELSVDFEPAKILDLLRGFLRVQQRRAEAYARLHRYCRGFADYLAHGDDLAYQKLCAEITTAFNDCSKQVLEMESLFLMPDVSRSDLACLLRDIQAEEKKKLHMTTRIQMLKVGWSLERLVSHERCSFMSREEQECRHAGEITEVDGIKDAEAHAEHANSLKDAIRGVQDAVTSINYRLEEIRYEIDSIQSD